MHSIAKYDMATAIIYNKHIILKKYNNNYELFNI